MDSLATSLVLLHVGRLLMHSRYVTVLSFNGNLLLGIKNFTRMKRSRMVRGDDGERGPFFFLRDHKGKGRKEVGRGGEEAPLGGEEGGPPPLTLSAPLIQHWGPPTWLDLSLLLSRSLASFPLPPFLFIPSAPPPPPPPLLSLPSLPPRP